jgi:hypothetical protein
MALHEQVSKSDEWYTPPRVFEALGVEFDMDVSSPGQAVTPWVPAREFKTTDSLNRLWQGFVWCNPPFGGRNGIVPWLEKFMRHGNGIALTPDRTSAPWWSDYARQADAILFVRSKIRFIPGNGAKESAPAQGTTLMARGQKAVAALLNAERNGLGFVMQPAVSESPVARNTTFGTKTND